jgi:hypothetical protein
LEDSEGGTDREVRSTLTSAIPDSEEGAFLPEAEGQEGGAEVLGGGSIWVVRPTWDTTFLFQRLLAATSVCRCTYAPRTTTEKS